VKVNFGIFQTQPRARALTAKTNSRIELQGDDTMSKIEAKLLRILVLLCLVLGPTPLAFPQGQTTGAVKGRAYEVGTNLPIAGVIITVTNRETGLERTTITGTDGSYLITTLPPALYSITATAKGYETDPVPDFPIRLGKTNTVSPPPFGMRKVNASAPTPPVQPVQTPQASSSSTRNESRVEQLTNTVNATRSGNYDTRQLLALPLPATRTFDDLAFLSPGVTEPPEPIGRILGPGVGPGIGSSGQFSVNGMRARSNNFTIDGSDDNDPDVGMRRQGFVALVPQTPESVQEFQIATLLWDAEFGRNFGSQVNAVSKGGGNAYHGQLYEFFTDSRLNARNTFSTGGRKDPFTRSLTGFLVGGPIGSKRTQFFTSFERDGINDTPLRIANGSGASLSGGWGIQNTQSR
jgi:hypothetical protein